MSSSDDEFDLGIPTGTISTGAIEDEMSYELAVNLSFVGVGQGGGRMAEAFYGLGYRRVCVVNTTRQDMVALQIPDVDKLDLGGGGAGKDPSVAAETIKHKTEDVFDLLKRTWGDGTDYGIVCFGAGGGTGAGCSPAVIETVRRLLDQQRNGARTGCLVALPKASEGAKAARNALRTLEQLNKVTDLSPILVMDNDRIRELHDPTPATEFPVANTSIAKLLHNFNRLAAADSSHTTFDKKDFRVMLDSGLIGLGGTPIRSWQTATDISKAVRDQLARNILVAADLAEANAAALLFVCGQKVYESIKTSSLDHGYETLSRLLGPDATVFRGLYPVEGSTLTALVMAGGLPWPLIKMKELAKAAGYQEVPSWV